MLFCADYYLSYTADHFSRIIQKCEDKKEHPSPIHNKNKVSLVSLLWNAQLCRQHLGLVL